MPKNKNCPLCETSNFELIEVTINETTVVVCRLCAALAGVQAEDPENKDPREQILSMIHLSTSLLAKKIDERHTLRTLEEALDYDILMEALTRIAQQTSPSEFNLASEPNKKGDAIFITLGEKKIDLFFDDEGSLIQTDFGSE